MLATRMRNFELTGVKWQNSPSFHIKIDDSDSIYIHDMEVYVSLWGHLALDRLLGTSSDFSLPVPTFPLNTDGIDPSGTNILIERVKITNFDDAVAIKPADKEGKIATCA